MKKINKFIKCTFAVLFTTIMLIASVLNVQAAPETIKIKEAPTTKQYIAGVSFHYKRTVDNQELFCLNMNKKTASNVTARLVANSKTIDGGIVYILKNGYPNKSITKDNDKDYYITQSAIWWYLDKTTGSTNLGEQFKSTGSDPHGLRKYIIQLVNDAYNHRNDSLGFSETKLVISTSNNKMTLKDGYYISNSIKATTLQNVGSYTVTLSGAPKGTKIVKTSGEEANYENGFNVQNDQSFIIKVPAKSLTSSQNSIRITAKTQGTTQYMAYEYQPEDNTMQSVALLEKRQNESKSELTLNFDTSKVKIIKTDSITKKPLAGAKLVVKDATGKVITSWTSTLNAHVIGNLSNGKYTIEEVEAPKGYQKNGRVIPFEISNKVKNLTLNIENAPKRVVVNITKIDQETNLPLAGAVLVVKDASGKEIARFTTTEESYVLTDLENGTYTVEEISAPAGYMINNEKITFTIDDEHLSHQITFINVKEVSVPNTSTVSSLILLILGIGITGLGIKYITKNAK